LGFGVTGGFPNHSEILLDFVNAALPESIGWNFYL
jgi:hypothetical protein